MAADLEPQFRPPEHLRSAVKDVSVTLLTALRKTARSHDWALGVHGSMERDLDLIATPWSDSASDQETFVEALRASAEQALDGVCHVSSYSQKPHQRMAYTLTLNAESLVHSSAGAHPFIDLSVLDARYHAPHKESTDVRT